MLPRNKFVKAKVVGQRNSNVGDEFDFGSYVGGCKGHVDQYVGVAGECREVGENLGFESDVVVGIIFVTEGYGYREVTTVAALGIVDGWIVKISFFSGQEWDCG